MILPRFLLRRGTTTQWAATNPVLLEGEPGYNKTTGDLRIGDGVTAWSSLPSQLASGKVGKGDLLTNVKDYGAKGDGAADDTAAIQAAIDSLPLNPANDGILSPLGYANGGTVYIPRGRYKVTGTLTLRRGIHLTGESRESSQLISYTAGSVLKYLDSGRYIQDEIVIENLSVWQHSSVPATSGAAIDVTFGSVSPPSTNLICRNVIVHDTYRGVRLGAGIWATVANVFVAGTVGNGFEVAYTDGSQSSPTTSTTFQNCYASGSTTGAGFHVTSASYLSFVGCASDSNATYGYHLIGGTTNTLIGCGAEDNVGGGAYLKNTEAAVVNLNVVHTIAGARHGISLETCDGTTMLGGAYNATGSTGYGIHVVANAGPVTAIGTKFAGNYASQVCDSASKFLNLTAAKGLVGGPNNNWAIGVDATPDVNSTFQVGGTAASSTGLKVDPVFGTSTANNMAAQVKAQTAATAVTYPVVYALQVPNAVKGAGSTITRAAGVNIAEQTQGGTGNANLFIDTGTALPAGNWSVYSASTRDSVFTGPIRSGSGTGPKWQSGTGTPEGVVTAPVGSLYSRTDGGAGTSLYVKESGTGNTGWVAK